MDQELREYLDKRFGETEKRFGETEKRFFAETEKLLGETEKLREYLDKRFGETEKQIQEFRQETSERFEGLEAEVRQTRVLVEGLRGEIQLVAAGVATVDAKLERSKEEQAWEVKDIRATMHLPYPPLDRRVTSLETRVEKLENAPPPRKRSPSSRAGSG
jgi:chromosome segregation ATPase